MYGLDSIDRITEDTVSDQIVESQSYFTRFLSSNSIFGGGQVRILFNGFGHRGASIGKLWVHRV